MRKGTIWPALSVWMLTAYRFFSSFFIGSVRSSVSDPEPA